MSVAYLNGEFLPKAQIAISPEDRGFLFADGLYEVVRSYDGRLFQMEAHLALGYVHFSRNRSALMHREFEVARELAPPRLKRYA